VFLKNVLFVVILHVYISVFSYVMFRIFVLCFIYVAKNFIKGSAEIFKVQKGSMPKLNWETLL
jgi:hypothetical protein